jgi:MFS family permease
VRPTAAGALVFGSSASVLVMEILAARLLAPYVGVTLETYTGIIGTILAAIAVGTWLGGRLADRRDPRALLGPTLILGGGLALLIVPIVRAVGALPLGAGVPAVLVLVLVGFFAPAAVLSAVSPMVVKLQLASLDRTGSTVGRLSALGTAGAIAGTFVTGLVLVAAWPTTPILVGVAIAVIAVGVVVTAARQHGRRRARVVGTACLVAVVGAAGAFGVNAALDPCDRESAYYCARVDAEGLNCPDGLTLYLDTLRHSCVYPDDPTRLGYSYARRFADVLGAAAGPGRQPLDVLHVGGGGFTLPRYVSAAHPGSTNTVLELDQVLVDIARDELGFVDSADTGVIVGDARTGIRALPDDAFDVVLGDAFGALAVPWHLTTTQWLAEVDRVLRPSGVYAVNIIDRPPLAFARSHAASMVAVFGHVAVSVPDGVVEGTARGNIVLIGSHAPIDAAAILAAADTGNRLLTGEQAAAFIGEATPLTDDYAPVDQLLAAGRG